MGRLLFCETKELCHRGSNGFFADQNLAGLDQEKRPEIFDIFKSVCLKAGHAPSNFCLGWVKAEVLGPLFS
jgi:hypothetical protein